MDGGTEINNHDDNKIVVSNPVTALNEVEPVAEASLTQAVEGSITWTASEFVAHKKSPLWYASVILASVILAGLTLLITKDKISASVIVVAAIILIIFGAKRPRELDYRIDSQGLHIGGKSFSFDRFRSFATVHQGSFSSLILFPLKRFSLLTTAYYDPKDEQKIVAMISNYLPIEERRRDFIDDLMWKIRF